MKEKKIFENYYGNKGFDIITKENKLLREDAIIIPHGLFFNPRINARELHFLASIIEGHNFREHLPCTKTNKELAENMRSTPGSVAVLISNMKKRKFIDVRKIGRTRVILSPDLKMMIAEMGCRSLEANLLSDEEQ